MGELAHIPNDRAAIQTTLKELDWAYEVQMLLIDLIGDVQADSTLRLNYQNMKKAAAARIRKSTRQRDAALDVLNGEAV